LSLDVAVFYNRYSQLRFLEPGQPELLAVDMPYLLVPVSPVNGPGARTWGSEVLAVWEASPVWELTGSYSWLRPPRPSQSPTLLLAEVTEAASHLASLRSQLDLTNRTELDAAAYYVDEVPGRDFDVLFSRASIPGAVRLDVRLSHDVTDRIEFSVVGQDLLNDHRSEFTPEGFAHPAEVRRSIYVQLRWRY
jgi:iron complex outermembrane receptor protein